jgi:hypothetical protein
MMWFPDDIDPDLNLLIRTEEDDSDSDISPDQMSEPSKQEAQMNSQSSQLKVNRLLDSLPILMRRHTLFPEDSDDNEDFIKIEDTCDTESDTSLFSIESAPSLQSPDDFEELANLPHEIVERSR